jgi:orotidine-5'-phosphate decarboxylase
VRFIFAGVAILIQTHPVEESLTTKDKIIVALDLPSIDSARDLINTLGKDVSWYKIGLQLFALGGPAFVLEVKAAGAKIFLDLKFHDIPNTVRSAVESACALGADMLTIHLSGGSEMCQAAVKGRASNSTVILGVTVLTSQTEATLSEIGINRSISQQVVSLAKLAQATGVTGLIASPLELEPLRQEFGKSFVIVTPGVRPVWSEAGDQKRFTTPADAIKLGADYLVIGRPITAAVDPKAAFARIAAELPGNQ